MKRISIIWIVLIATSIALSCQREMQLETETQVQTFRASFAEAAHTRTALQPDGVSVWWSPKDTIDIFYGGRDEFVSNNTQPAPVVSFYGSFSSFSGVVESGTAPRKYFAVYPSREKNGTYSSYDGQYGVTLTVEDVQRGVAGSFGKGYFPAVAISNNLDLAFYNVCGGARFSVAHEGIECVVFKANGGEFLAGEVIIVEGPDGIPAAEKRVFDGRSEVTVLAPEGGFVPGEHYFVALLPGTLSKGISMTFKKKDKSATFKTEKSITVNRSRFGTLDGKDEGLVFMNPGYVITKLGSYTDGAISDFTMAINPADNLPYFAYTRKVGDENHNVSIAKWNGSAFSLVGPAGLADASVRSASKPKVAFGKDGTVYAFYLGGEVTGRPTVKKLESEWVLVGDAGFTPYSNNSSYDYPFFVHPANGKLFYFWNGNNKNVDGYRTMNVSTFDGYSWSSSTVSGVIPAYGSGISSSSGMYFTSYAALTGEKAYIASSLNQFGYYVHEVNADGNLTTIVDNHLPNGAPYGLPSNLQLKTDSNGSLYLFAANAGGDGSMQIYKVDTDGMTLKAHGDGIPIEIGSTGAIIADCAFGISPTNGLIVAIIGNPSTTPAFKFLDGNLHWNDFDVDSSIAPSPGEFFSIEFDKDGKGYIAFRSANKIELYGVNPVSKH